jgi:predicted RNA-binding Zn-ribbon protein involved in translation (DUF1610 family)
VRVDSYMHIPKRYGESKVEGCPFCGKQAIIKNSQGVPVCMIHKAQRLPEMKCSCGGNLLLQEGKFGVFFNCPNCGNINMKRVIEMNSNNINEKNESVDKKKIVDIVERKESQKNFRIEKARRTSEVRRHIVRETEKKQNHTPSNIVIRSDDPRYFR